jgi:UDP-GlcNAc:undecaprenyl-phosphate/decaprenyl-phosphate GlcNAc-1-phosphate transferase
MIELFLVAIIINFLFFFYLYKIENIVNIFDTPDNKLKKHKSKVPLLGGFIIMINLCVFFSLTFFFDYQLLDNEMSLRSYFAIFFFLFSFFILGALDDKYKLKPEKKFFLSILFSIFFLSLSGDFLVSSIRLSFYDHLIFLHGFSFFFTIFCIIILINSLNFYDGINGQSIIFFIIIFGYLSYISPLYVVYLFIIFVLFFILILNLQSKLFMGDSGIYALGSVLITSLIYEYNVLKTIQYVDEIFFLLIVPGYDLLRLSITRIFNGKNAFYGDRNHIQHLLIKRFSLIQTNIYLILLILLPIFLFSFLGFNFFIVITLFTCVYIFLIFKFSKYDY